MHQLNDQGRNQNLPPGLGDIVHHALSLVGITEQRVSYWLGRKDIGGCGCDNRRQKLNQLTYWALSLVGGKVGSVIQNKPRTNLKAQDSDTMKRLLESFLEE